MARGINTPSTSTSMIARRSKRVVSSEPSRSPDSSQSCNKATPLLNDGFEDMDRNESDEDEPEKSNVPSGTPFPNVSPSSTSRSGIKLRLKIGLAPTELPGSTITDSTDRAKASRIGDVVAQRTDEQINIASRSSKRIRLSRQSSEAYDSTSWDHDQAVIPKPSENLDSEIESADDSDELEALHRGRDIERMTARQRSKLDAKYTEKLMVLPEDNSKKMVLTEQEKQRRKEETARRRKLQADQKQENDKRDAIDRLLKAQAGRGRSAKDAADARDTLTADLLPSYATRAGDVSNSLRFVSSTRNGELELRLAIPEHKLFSSKVPQVAVRSVPQKVVATVCAVPGCSEYRKYRCLTDREIGGCSAAHLKLLETLMR